MMLRIRSRDGLERVTVENPHNTTISIPKKTIENQLGIPTHNQTLSTNQNLLLAKSIEDLYRFTDMSNPDTPLSSLNLSHGSIVFLAYEGERSVPVPPQQGSEENLLFFRDPEEEKLVEVIAMGLGMRKVGFIFTQTVSQDKKDYTLSNREILQAAEYHAESGLTEE